MEPAKMTAVTFRPLDYRGRRYDRFFARKAPGTGPGWFIYGRNPEYNDTLVSVCAWPDRPRRKCPNYNGEVACGWPTKRAALESFANYCAENGIES